MLSLVDLQAADPFWLRYREDGNGCWLWQMALDEKGYGRIQNEKAHRVAYMKSVGIIPDHLNILHDCDTRSCGNPGHLTPGTQKKNLEDMRARGRGVNPPSPLGAANPSRVLTEEQARQVKRSTGRLKDTAQRYGIAVSTVSAIRNGRLWSHI